MKSLAHVRMLIIAFALALSAVPAFAGDVDGKWAGTVSTPNGDLMVGYDLKSEGTKLTGTTTGIDGGMVPIKDGKIDGDKIAFTVTLDLGGMMFDISYTGVVTAAEIKLTADFAGMPFEYVVKKTP